MSYDTARGTAARILAAKGKTVNVLRKGQGTIDPIASTRAPGGDLSGSFSCVALPPGRSAEFEVGSLVGRRVLQFYLSKRTGTLDPRPGDLLFWNGLNYTLIWTATYDPDASGTILTVAYGEVA